MIDWIAAIAPCQHPEPVTGGRTITIDAGGAIEWQSERLRSLPGSYASTLMLRTANEDRLLVSGKPAKWLQGHNLFESDDLVGLAAADLTRATRLLGMTPSSSDPDAWAAGNYHLARVDCTGMWRLRLRADVRSHLRTLERRARRRNRRPITRGATV